LHLTDVFDVLILILIERMLTLAVYAHAISIVTPSFESKGTLKGITAIYCVTSFVGLGVGGWMGRWVQFHAFVYRKVLYIYA